MKERLDEQTIALRVAKEFEDGMVVNLGIGIPTLASNFIPEGNEIILHSENGCLGYGPIVTSDCKEDFNLVNASGQFVSSQAGMSFFDQAESFAMIRGRHIDLCVLGGMQVSEEGDLANWSLSENKLGSIGGAMDLAFGAARIIVAMTHTTKDNKLKILKHCTFPVTARRCVNLIVTDLAVIEIITDGLILREIAPGWSIDEVQDLTEPKLIVHSNLKEIEL